MNTQGKLSFITAKIEDLQTAVFHNCSNAVLNIPSSVVHTLYVDETGCIWFTMLKPLQAITEFDRRFPVKLNYYQKGRPFFLDINGTARLVIDPEEINSLPDVVKSEVGNGKILICVKIKAANYHENKIPAPLKNPLHLIKDYVVSIFESNYHHINFDKKGFFA